MDGEGWMSDRSGEAAERQPIEEGLEQMALDDDVEEQFYVKCVWRREDGGWRMDQEGQSGTMTEEASSSSYSGSKSSLSVRPLYFPE